MLHRRSVFCKVFGYRVFQMAFDQAFSKVFSKVLHKVLYKRYSTASIRKGML